MYFDDRDLFTFLNSEEEMSIKNDAINVRKRNTITINIKHIINRITYTEGTVSELPVMKSRP